jgi:hypothetical protein
MKSTLLLILLFTPLFGFSQRYPDKNSYCQIETYYDYSLCAKGVKDENGQVILAPRFSGRTIKKERSEIHVNMFFIFQHYSNESFRMYDSNLKEIFSGENGLPSTSKTTVSDQTYVTVFSHGNKKTLFSQSGKIIVPTTIDNIVA